MIFLKFILGNDSNSYNMNMIGIYLFILCIAFVVCVVISNKLNIYRSKMNDSIWKKIDTADELQSEAMNEAAATTEEIRGTEDEQ